MVGLVVFFVGGFGCLAPCFLLLFALLADREEQRDNAWFRENGIVVDAIVTNKRVSRSSHRVSHIVYYQVESQAQAPFVDRDIPPAYLYNIVEIGDKIDVWLAGDRTRIVRENSKLLRWMAPIAVIPLVSLLLLLWLFMRQMRKGTFDSIVLRKMLLGDISSLKGDRKIELRGDNKDSSIPQK